MAANIALCRVTVQCKIQFDPKFNGLTSAPLLISSESLLTVALGNFGEKKLSLYYSIVFCFYTLSTQITKPENCLQCTVTPRLYWTHSGTSSQCSFSWNKCDKSV